MKEPEDEAFDELAKRQGDWGLQGSRKHQILRYSENVEKKENMNKPITPNKFAADLWGMMQMAIDEAVLAERDACAKLCERLPMQQEIDVRDQCAAAIRARGQA